MTTDQTPDPSLNDIGVLTRREIEARIMGPLLERMGEEFGADRVQEIAAEVIIDIAKAQGAAMAEHLSGNDLAAFADSLANWTKGGALELEVVEQTEEVFAFNVTRCRYAEMYRDLGLADLGATFSCNRDATLIQGFNPDVEFTRTQTIMGGADHCDFVYRLPPETDG